MKTRTGFVSNSSTTSFCLCGIYMDNKELRELFSVESEYEIEGDGVDLYSQEYSYGSYVGVDIDRMEDNETKAEFKERVRKLLSDKAGQDVGPVGFMTDGWYNG